MVVGDSSKSRAILHVDRTVALHLISLRTWLAIEEVAVVNPVVVVVCIHRHSIVAKEHYAEVTNLQSPGAFETYTVAVECCIVAYALKGYIL